MNEKNILDHDIRQLFLCGLSHRADWNLMRTNSFANILPICNDLFSLPYNPYIKIDFSCSSWLEI